MANKSYMAETREAAYEAFWKCGQNYELTVKELKKQDYTISKPTLYEWCKKYNWLERIARAEAQRQEAKDAMRSFEDTMFADMVKQKTAYETYLETLGAAKVDVNAMNGYINLCKTITDVRTKTGAYKASLFLEFMKDLIGWLSKNDPESVAAIERNFDDFVNHAKEQYQ